MDKKITLIITGQLRLQENQNTIDKINYHIDKLKPHNTILFLWDSEYQQYQNEIKQLNLMLELKDTKINLLEKQIYILEKYKND